MVNVLVTLNYLIPIMVIVTNNYYLMLGLLFNAQCQIITNYTSFSSSFVGIQGHVHGLHVCGIV